MIDLEIKFRGIKINISKQYIINKEIMRSKGYLKIWRYIYIINKIFKIERLTDLGDLLSL